MVKAVILDGGGTIWYSMKVLYEHYKIGVSYLGLIRSVDEFPYSFILMNELSCFRNFNSRWNIAKALIALIMMGKKEGDLENIITTDGEGQVIRYIEELRNSKKSARFEKLSSKLGFFLEEALYNYPEEWYPPCE